MAQDNLSEILFKPTVIQRETSTLIRRSHPAESCALFSTLDGETTSGWYRMLNRLKWIWQGVDPVELEQILARIAISDAARSNGQWLDTVQGYRNGNWIYEWVCQGMQWQHKAQELQTEGNPQAGHHWLKATMYYNIAGYPYLRGDPLAEQALLLATRAYDESIPWLPCTVKSLEFSYGKNQVRGALYLPQPADKSYPTVLLCHGLISSYTDYHRLFMEYFAPAGIAMLALDTESSTYILNHESGCLYQQVLNQLPTIPWIDHQRVALLGMRFGANTAVRLGYLEAKKIKAIACIGPVVHQLLSDSQLQQQLPAMVFDVFASRLGLEDISDEALRQELSCFSLKLQGLLGHRCQTPIMVAHWENDLLSPLDEAKLIINSCSNGRLLKISTRPVYENFYRALSETTRWLKARLD
ncbi:MAG: esterase FrsA [Enterobacteriaceae bacterium]